MIRSVEIPVQFAVASEKDITDEQLQELLSRAEVGFKDCGEEDEEDDDDDTRELRVVFCRSDPARIVPCSTPTRYLLEIRKEGNPDEPRSSHWIVRTFSTKHYGCADRTMYAERFMDFYAMALPYAAFGLKLDVASGEFRLITLKSPSEASNGLRQDWDGILMARGSPLKLPLHATERLTGAQLFLKQWNDFMLCRTYKVLVSAYEPGRTEDEADYERTIFSARNQADLPLAIRRAVRLVGDNPLQLNVAFLPAGMLASVHGWLEHAVNSTDEPIPEDEPADKPDPEKKPCQHFDDE